MSTKATYLWRRLVLRWLGLIARELHDLLLATGRMPDGRQRSVELDALLDESGRVAQQLVVEEHDDRGEEDEPLHGEYGEGSQRQKRREPQYNRRRKGRGA